MSDLPRNLYVAKRLKGKRIFQGRIYFLVEWDQDINHCELEDTWEPIENIIGEDLIKETTSRLEALNASGPNDGYSEDSVQTLRDTSSSDESSTHINTPPSYFEESRVVLTRDEVSQEYTPSQCRNKSLELGKSFQEMFSPPMNTPLNRTPESYELPKFNTPSYLSPFQEPIMTTPKSKYKNLPVFDTPSRLSYSPLTPVRKCLWKVSNNAISPSENKPFGRESTVKSHTHNLNVAASHTQHSHSTFSDHSDRYPQNSQLTNHDYISQSSVEIMDEFYTRLLEEAEAEAQKEAIMENTNKNSLDPPQCDSQSANWDDPRSIANSPLIFIKSKRDFQKAFELQSAPLYQPSTSKSNLTASTKRHHTMTGSAYELLLATTSEIELLRVDKSKEKKFYQNLIAKSMLITNIELKNELIDFVELKDSESQWPIKDWRILPQSELWLFKVSEVQKEVSETQKCVCLVLNVPKRKITSILLPSWLMQQQHSQQTDPAPLCDDGCDTGSHLCQLQCCHGNPLSIENLSRFIESQVNFTCKNLSSSSMQEIIDSAEKISETLSFLYNQSPSKSNTVAQEDLAIVMETQQPSKALTPCKQFESSTPIRSLTPELVDVEESEISLSFEGPLCFSSEQYEPTTKNDLPTQEDGSTPSDYRLKPRDHHSRVSEPPGSPSYLTESMPSPTTLRYRVELDGLQQSSLDQYQFRSPADLSTCRTRKSPTNSIRSDKLLGSGRSQRNSINLKPSQNISLSLDLVSQDSVSQSPILSLDFMDFQVLQRADLYRAYTKLKRENRKMKSRISDPVTARR